jgi:hypothetical protein
MPRALRGDKGDYPRKRKWPGEGQHGHLVLIRISYLSVTLTMRPSLSVVLGGMARSCPLSCGQTPAAISLNESERSLASTVIINVHPGLAKRLTFTR